MPDAYIFDAVRTPRGRGKQDGSLHEVTSLALAAKFPRATFQSTAISALYQPLSSRTIGSPRITSDTNDFETPARAATSRIVGRRWPFDPLCSAMQSGLFRRAARSLAPLPIRFRFRDGLVELLLQEHAHTLGGSAHLIEFGIARGELGLRVIEFAAQFILRRSGIDRS